MELLKKMNYRVIRFGAETGSNRLLKQIKGNSASVSHHQRLIDLAYKYGLPCSGSFMFGIPGESVDDILKTLKFLDKNRKKLSISGLYFYNPIPGTELYNRILAETGIASDFFCEDMYLDMLHPKFEIKETHYFNEKKVPLNTLIRYVHKIRNEFIK